MLTSELLDAWRAEHELPTEGWDFSELADRIEEESPPWSYPEMARSVLTGATSALDMGTGGGEVLQELAGALPEDTVATEGWPPNVPVAARNLAPYGITVERYDAETDAAMPFPDGRFGVVLNRHEAYRADEVLRVLRPGGAFFTQQVDGRDFEETQALFGGQGAWSHITLDNLQAEALAAGLTVAECQDWQGHLTFGDVGAMVRYFAHVPWEVPEDFTVDRYAAQLLDLHSSGRPLTFTQRRFYLLLRRPG